MAPYKRVGQTAGIDQIGDVAAGDIENFGGQFGGGWPKLEGLLVANGYEALRLRATELEKLAGAG